MTNTLTNAAAIVNEALARVGYKKRIGSLYDGSEASVLALGIYGQCRDNLLRGFEWGFASRNASLTLQKTAPVGGYSALEPWTNANPAPPWIYQYAYPSDMVRLLALRQVSVIPEYDPQPVEFDISNDNSFNPPQRVILTNIGPTVIADYTAQITDPTSWDVGFTEALITALGSRLVPALMGLEAVKITTAQEMVAAKTAETELG